MHESTPTITPVALYARVSTEDQAERDTVQMQLDFLHKYCELYNLPIAGVYIDDGISGTVAFNRRPDGQRLVADAKANAFKSVLFYKLSRFGRRLGVILDAYNELTDLGIWIRSATEALDTSTANGRFVFQILGAVAELDRETISENTTLGRNRVAAKGQYTGGPIPLGYELDADKCFVLSTRMVPELGITEAEMVSDIFLRLANGETTLSRECARLTALGVPRRQRYALSEKRRRDGHDAAVIERRNGWGVSSLGGIIRNPIYKGQGIVASHYGQIERPAPALVSPETWKRAKDQLEKNRQLSTKNAKNVYLLRGLITCANCGRSYVGTTGNNTRRYRCNTNVGSAAHTHERCEAKLLPADWLEAAVWAECRAFILNPGDALDEARRKLRARLETSAGFDERRRHVTTQLAAKDTERERVLTLFRRGTITADEAEQELNAVAREAGHLREELESMRAHAALIDAQETDLTESVALLGRLRDELVEIEATNDLERKRDVIARYVRKVTVTSRRVGPRKLDADVRIYLRLKPEPIAVDCATCSPAEDNCIVEIELLVHAA